MSQHVPTRRLRLHLFTSSYLQRTQRASTPCRAFSFSQQSLKSSSSGQDVTNDFERRVQQLEARLPPSEWYPRLDQSSRKVKSPRAIRLRHEASEVDTPGLERTEIVAGRVQTVRTAGSKLIFVTLKTGDETVQATIALDKIIEKTNGKHHVEGLEAEKVQREVKRFAKTVRKGDWWQIQGYPHRNDKGTLSVVATLPPVLLSPSLHQIPEVLEDAETRARNRHVDMLVNPSALLTVRVRHLVEKYMKDFFDQEGFTSVHTPLLAAGAGGAVARPFQTKATELGSQTLDLRIAPELWLKRLVIGGMDKVYEMGPAFRNEGVDATHNPEFYMCEFYEVFATLDRLMVRTEKLLKYISVALARRQQHNPNINDMPPLPTFAAFFTQLQFIPTLEKQMDQSLPDLDSSAAHDELLEIFRTRDIPPPSKPTLPRLLDALSSHYLEPLCEGPTFIINHPACLSPLSKHFTCPNTAQTVSARAELFIGGREIANMYEEENSPFEQRRKFQEQLKYRTVDGEGDDMVIDESYVKALEWGMPPTGGWGCGVDRLVMLFSGRERIGDVLPFGGLRNVVGVGK